MAFSLFGLFGNDDKKKVKAPSADPMPILTQQGSSLLNNQGVDFKEKLDVEEILGMSIPQVSRQQFASYQKKASVKAWQDKNDPKLKKSAERALNFKADAPKTSNERITLPDTPTDIDIERVKNELWNIREESAARTAGGEFMGGFASNAIGETGDLILGLLTGDSQGKRGVINTTRPGRKQILMDYLERWRPEEAAMMRMAKVTGESPIAEMVGGVTGDLATAIIPAAGAMNAVKALPVIQKMHKGTERARVIAIILENTAQELASTGFITAKKGQTFDDFARNVAASPSVLLPYTRSWQIAAAPLIDYLTARAYGMNQEEALLNAGVGLMGGALQRLDVKYALAQQEARRIHQVVNAANPPPLQEVLRMMDNAARKIEKEARLLDLKPKEGMSYIGERKLTGVGGPDPLSRRTEGEDILTQAAQAAEQKAATKQMDIPEEVSPPVRQREELAIRSEPTKTEAPAKGVAGSEDDPFTRLLRESDQAAATQRVEKARQLETALLETADVRDVDVRKALQDVGNTLDEIRRTDVNLESGRALGTELRKLEQQGAFKFLGNDIVVRRVDSGTAANDLLEEALDFHGGTSPIGRRIQQVIEDRRRGTYESHEEVFDQFSPDDGLAGDSFDAGVAEAVQGLDRQPRSIIERVDEAFRSGYLPENASVIIDGNEVPIKSLIRRYEDILDRRSSAKQVGAKAGGESSQAYSKPGSKRPAEKESGVKAQKATQEPSKSSSGTTPPSRGSTQPGGRKKRPERRLAKKLRKSDIVPPEIQQGIKESDRRFYERISDTEAIEYAQESVKDSLSGSERMVLSEANPDKYTYVLAREVVLKRIEQKDYSAALDVLEHVMTNSTTNAQALQSLHLFSVLTGKPEAALKFAEKQLSGAARKNRTFNSIEKMSGQIAKQLNNATSNKARDRIINQLTRKIPQRKQRDLHDRLMEMANKGVLSRRDILGVVADKLKLPFLDERMASDIVKRSNKIQEMPLGPERNRAIQDMLESIYARVPIGWSEIADAYRYTNMLSSPKTQERNIYSNLIQTFITRPTELAFEGGIDLVQSAITGKAREAYISDVPIYYRNAIAGIVDATHAAGEVLKGRAGVSHPDIWLAARTAAQRKLPTSLQIIPRMMEAADRFFATTIAAGDYAVRRRRGINDMEAREAAEMLAEKYLFRGKFDLDQTDASVIARALDHVGNKLVQIRKAPVIGKPFSWFVPFVTTPIKYARLNVEFSPLGLISNPKTYSREQMAKAFAGTTVTTIGAFYAFNGKTTWDAPTNREEKDAFYAAGRKPYSVNIGGKWVPMWYFGPFAFAFAIPAAIKNEMQDRPEALTESRMKQVADISLNLTKFLASQTPLTGVAGLFRLLEGDVDYSDPAKIAVFTGTQFLPLSGLVRYTNQIIDPVYRKASGASEQLKKDIPFFSQDLPAYTLPTGEESKRDPLNSIIPYDVGKTQPDFELLYKSLQARSQSRNMKNKLKKILEDDTRTAEWRVKELDKVINRIENRVSDLPIFDLLEE